MNILSILATKRLKKCCSPFSEDASSKGNELILELIKYSNFKIISSVQMRLKRSSNPAIKYAPFSSERQTNALSTRYIAQLVKC